MANSITRRSSSKQGWEDIIRMTVQRSLEDAEELAKEQRRRSREKQTGPGGPPTPWPTTLTPQNSPLRPTTLTQQNSPPTLRPTPLTQQNSPLRPTPLTQQNSPLRPTTLTQQNSPLRPTTLTQQNSPLKPTTLTQQNSPPTLRPITLTQQNSPLSQEAMRDTEMKASQQPAVEEDEGFSDWTRNQRPLEEQEDWTRSQQRPLEEQEDWTRSQQRPLEEQEDWQPEHTTAAPEELESENTAAAPEENVRPSEEKEDVGGSGLSCEASRTHQDQKTGVNKKEVKVSYSSTVFRQHTNGHTADRTSYQNLLTIKPCGPAECGEEAEALSERERRLEEGRPSHVEEQEQALVQGSEELEKRVPGSEELSCRVEEEPQGKGDLLDHSLEERCSASKLEEEHNHIPEEEDRERLNPERRRTQEVDQERSSATLCNNSNEEEQSINPFSPMSPTFKKLLIQFYPNEMEARVTAESTCTITERTECLSRSLKNSIDSVKKTPPLLTVAKIDNKLEQYTHAVKVSSEDATAARQLLTDLPAPAEPVASKKSLFEAGDAWNQQSMKVPLSKDVESINVGVADLINQWVKGGSDGARSSSASKTAEIKPGDVLSKKNLWENLGDAVCSGRAEKGSSSGKRYRFLVTGHGKYEKVAAADDGHNERT